MNKSDNNYICNLSLIHIQMCIRDRLKTAQFSRQNHEYYPNKPNKNEQPLVTEKRLYNINNKREKIQCK